MFYHLNSNLYSIFFEFSKYYSISYFIKSYLFLNSSNIRFLKPFALFCIWVLNDLISLVFVPLFPSSITIVVFFVGYFPFLASFFPLLLLLSSTGWESLYSSFLSSILKESIRSPGHVLLIDRSLPVSMFVPFCFMR